MFRLLIGLLALLALPSLSACNTARGMGEDVEAAGRAMSGTAEDVEEDISGEPDKPKGTTEQGTMEEDMMEEDTMEEDTMQ